MWAALLKAGKDLIKKKASKNAKNKLLQPKSSYGGIYALLAQFVSMIIVIIIVIAIVIAPLIYAHEMIENIIDKVGEDYYRVKTTTWTAFKGWIAGEDPTAKYADYLKSEFETINSKIADGTVTGDEVDKTKAMAVGWVYGQLYEKYFDTTSVEKIFSGLLGWVKPPWIDKAPGQDVVLKGVRDTALEVYDPYKQNIKEDIAIQRNEQFNDLINVYDLEAFDFVGGPLANLMEFDIQKVRQTITANHIAEIEAQKNAAVLPTYQQYTPDLLKLYSEYSNLIINGKDINGFDGINTILNKNNLSNCTLSGASNLEKLYSILTIQGEYNSSQDVKYVADKLKSCNLSGDNYSAIANTMVKSTSAFWKIYYLDNQLPIILKGYINSMNVSDEIKKDLIFNINGILEYGKINNKTLYDQKHDINNNIASIIGDSESVITNNIVNSLVDKEIETVVDSLHLNITDEMANQYNIALKAKEEATTVSYYSLNKTYFTDVINLQDYYITYSPILHTLELKSKPIYSSTEDFFNDIGIGEDVKLDNNGLPIVVAYDNKNNINYLGNTPEVYKNLTLHSLDTIKETVQNRINTTVNAAMGDTGEIAIGYQDIASEVIDKLNYIDNKYPKLKNYSGYSGYDYNIRYYIAQKQYSNLISQLGNVSAVYNAIDDAYPTEVIDPNLGMMVPGDPNIIEINNILKNKIAEIKGYKAVFDALVNQKEDLIAKLNDYATKEINAINEAKANIVNLPTSGADYYKNTNYYTPSDISNYASQSKIGTNTLRIQKYTNTVEDAVKLVASSVYRDKLLEYGEDTAFANTSAISVGNIVLGKNLSSTKYRNAYKYYDQIKPIADKLLLDPNLVVALISVESGGNPTANNSDNSFGLMQIDKGHLNQTFVLHYADGTTESVTYTDANKYDVIINLKVGMSILKGSLASCYYNLPVSIQGYNYGAAGVKYTITKYLQDSNIGNASLSDWDRSYAVHNPTSTAIENYIKGATDTNWLGERTWFSTIGYKYFAPHASGFGDPSYLEKVMSYYNTQNGMPWVARADGSKITVNFGGTPTVLNTDTTSTNKSGSYYNGNQLILWKQYYTDNRIFEAANNWAEEEWAKNPLMPKPTKKLSDMISDDIVSYTTDNTIQTKYMAFGISTQQFQAIIAGTLNEECDFKIEKPYEIDVKKRIEDTGNKYLNMFGITKGKDVSFAIYLYVTPSDELELAKATINGVTDFNQYVKDSAQSQSSLTSSEESFRKVAQIITGNKAVNVDDIFKIEQNTTNTGETVDSLELFYKDWLNAKIMITEIYNSQIDETKGLSAEEKAKLKLTVPTNPYDDNGLNNYQPSDGGTISLTGGDLSITELPITKLPITKNFAYGPREIKYIVIHDTANTNVGADARANRDYFNTNTRQASAHYLVDDKEIVQAVDDDNIAWHCGDKTYIDTGLTRNRPEITNSNSIGIEICINSDGDSNKTFWDAVAITKYIMTRYNISVDNVVRHFDVTTKNCPATYIKDNNFLWNKFKAAISNSTIKVTYKESTGLIGDGTATPQNIVLYAKQFLGIPYLWGGTSPTTGFDCSGFTQYVYKHFGITINRLAQAQMQNGTPVPKGQEQMGDLVFFGTASKIHHVGIYVGDGKYIHSPHTGDVIKISTLSLADDYYGAVRILK